jgi:gamma-polyglutamate biosynthesis protein CapA
MKKAVLLLSVAALLFAAFVIFPRDLGKITIKYEESGSVAEPFFATTTLLMVGDVMLGRNVENLMLEHGMEYPFAQIGDFLNTADAVVANLEGPVITNHKKTPSGSFSFNFLPDIVPVLKKYNVELVTLANNHTFDYGAQGFDETADYLDNAGVEAFGHPTKVTEALYKNIGSTTFAFLGFNAIRALDIAQATSAIAIARTHADFVIVNVHWGEEYSPSSNSFQRKTGRAFIDSGADTVVGHHPHVVQEIEMYKDRPIFYSLGNFIFDQYFSKEVQEGLAVQLEVGKTELTYSLIPIENLTRSQPSVAIATSSAERISTLISKSRGVTVGTFTLLRQENTMVE